MTSAPPKVLVAVATYNERGNLEGLIREIHVHVPHAHVLVTDDNSPDGTGQLADQLAAADPRVFVRHRPGKMGLGTAILAGMKHSVEHGYDIHVSMDADFSHHPKYLPALLAGAERVDVMIGSRYIPGGGTVNWPVSRKFMSWAVNVFCRLVMRFRPKDASGGYRAYRLDLLKRVDLDNFRSVGYSFQQEMLLRCKFAKATMDETPIVFEDRRAGATKANLKEIVRSSWTLFVLGMRSLVGLSPSGR